MIEAKKAEYPVTLMCRLLGVSRSGFYAWRHRSSSRAQEEAELMPKVRAAHRASRGTYGSPRVHRILKNAGVQAGRHRIARLMREHGLVGRPKRRFRKTTDSAHADPVAPNRLARAFSASRPNEVWVGDITYLWTSEGWLYLAVLLDLFSRRVVGWSMGQDLRTELPLRALKMALGRRDVTSGLLHHSDQGCQYTSASYQEALAKAGIQCSMSRRGDCWDNAVAESFFGTLKTELVHRTSWRTRREARAEVYEYIEVFYNRQRLHSTLDYQSPCVFEGAAERRPMETATVAEIAPRFPQPFGKRPSPFSTVPTGPTTTSIEKELGTTP